MQTFFSFIGTTAVGKTSTVLAVAEQLIASHVVAGVVLLSADSRQVYEGLEVLSGADVPDHFKRNQVAHIAGKNYFEWQNIFLSGVSCISPSDEWSVAHFQQYARLVLEWAAERKYLVCVVGGTGLYHEQILQTDAALHVPPDEKLRSWAADRTVAELQEKLEELNQSSLDALNQSDRQNPVRLVRAIERSEYLKSARPKLQPALGEQFAGFAPEEYAQKYIGFERSDAVIQSAIFARVQERFETRAVDEVRELRSRPDLSTQVQKTLGFSEICQFLDNELSADACQELWSLHEWQYAKRQKTWWKRLQTATWYSTETKDVPETIAAVAAQLRSSL